MATGHPAPFRSPRRSRSATSLPAGKSKLAPFSAAWSRCLRPGRSPTGLLRARCGRTEQLLPASLQGTPRRSPPLDWRFLEATSNMAGCSPTRQARSGSGVRAPHSPSFIQRQATFPSGSATRMRLVRSCLLSRCPPATTRGTRPPVLDGQKWRVCSCAGRLRLRTCAGLARRQDAAGPSKPRRATARAEHQRRVVGIMA